MWERTCGTGRGKHGTRSAWDTRESYSAGGAHPPPARSFTAVWRRQSESRGTVLVRGSVVAPHSAVSALAFLLATLMPSCSARLIRDDLLFDPTQDAMVAEYVSVCIIRASSSFIFVTTKVLRPLGRTCLVFLFDPYPIFGSGSWPLKRRRTLLSIPFGFLHDS